MFLLMALHWDDGEVPGGLCVPKQRSCLFSGTSVQDQINMLLDLVFFLQGQSKFV